MLPSDILAIMTNEPLLFGYELTDMIPCSIPVILSSLKEKLGSDMRKSVFVWFVPSRLTEPFVKLK